MTPWARQARNKALGDKRKAAKQGQAVAEFLRKTKEIEEKKKCELDETDMDKDGDK